MLVHMTPKEVASLQGLAAIQGGSLTINPDTGLPEAGILGSFLPMLAGAASQYFMPGNPWGAALMGGVTSMAVNGPSLQSGITGALGGYGGSSMMSSFMAPDVTTASLQGNWANNAAPNPMAQIAMNGGNLDAIAASLAPQGGLNAAQMAQGMSEALPAAAPAATVGPQTWAELSAREAAMMPTPGVDGVTAMGPSEAAKIIPTAAEVTTPAAPAYNPSTPIQNSIASGAKLPMSTPVAQAEPQMSMRPDAPVPEKAPNVPTSGLSKLFNMDTYYKEGVGDKPGKITMPGYLALTGVGAGLNALNTKSANKQSWAQYQKTNPYELDSSYQAAMRRAHAQGGIVGYAEGGVPNGYQPHASPHEVYQVGNEPRVAPFSGQMQQMAGGGIAGQPRFLKGAGDGMSDSIPANIDGKQPAALANEEFVIPADVVSHLGNGSSEAGAKQLYAMMDRIRKARTGTKKQGKQINPQKYAAA
jgi:hypothetical protein